MKTLGHIFVYVLLVIAILLMLSAVFALGMSYNVAAICQCVASGFFFWAADRLWYRLDIGNVRR